MHDSYENVYAYVAMIVILIKLLDHFGHDFGVDIHLDLKKFIEKLKNWKNIKFRFELLSV